MSRIFGVALLGALLGGCAALAVGNPNDPNWHPHNMTLAEYRAKVAREASHPADPNELSYEDRMAIIDATHAPLCGICDPISRRSPDGTYTVPPQNR